MILRDIKKYRFNNPKIVGFKLLANVKKKYGLEYAKSQLTYTLTNTAFKKYLKNREFSKKQLVEIKKSLRELFAISKSKKLVVKRAFFVPGMENPPGPRFLGVKDTQEALKAVEEIYKFAIESAYHKKKSSKIEISYYPFTDPPPVNSPIKSNDILPRGVVATTFDDSGKLVEVMAVFGNNEGTQSLKGVDKYVVDTKAMIIREKTIPQKSHGLFTTKKAQDSYLDIPLEKQFEQVLNDIEILQIATATAKCSELSGKRQRAEVSFDRDEFFFNEVLEYKEQKKSYKSIEFTGKVVAISSQEDIDKLNKKKEQIVYISKKVIKRRTFLVLNKLVEKARKKNLKLYVLYPGTNTTAHAMRVLVDAGHYAFTVGHREFRDREDVKITASAGGVRIEKKEAEGLLHLEDASSFKLSEVGGKAYNLSTLMLNGFRVPDGYVIRLDLQKFSHLEQRLSNQKKYSVRSSANIEDGTKNAFAGQFKTLLNVEKNNIKKAIEDVRKSANNKEVRALAKSLGLKNIKMAVIIQEMVDSKISGVIFGANIETRDKSQIVIELVHGLADKVVDNKSRVRRIVLDKYSGKVISDNKLMPKITKKQLKILYSMYLSIEEFFDSPQDIEWTIDNKGELFILQSRNLIV